MRLGLHTYSLYLHGIGQAWGGFHLPWPRQFSTFDVLDLLRELGLDGIHIDDGALESLDAVFLREVRAAADEKKLFIEYNFSMDMAHRGVGIQHDLSEAVNTAHALGADILKMSMDIVRPRPVSGSRFHPDVMAQLKAVSDIISKNLARLEETRIRLAVENHCDTFSEEILWLLEKIDSPMVGACLDTVNALMVMEDPVAAMENLAPRAFTNHFKDDKIELQRYGFKLTGTAAGEGDIDLKRAYRLIRDKSPSDRIIIETETDIPVDDKKTALAMEIDTIRRSIHYCREVLGIGK